jgi:hypothetical protein
MIQVIIDKDRPVGPTQRSCKLRQCLHAQFSIVLPQDNVLVSCALVYPLVMHAHAETLKSGNNGHFVLYPTRDGAARHCTHIEIECREDPDCVHL